MSLISRFLRKTVIVSVFLAFVFCFTAAGANATTSITVNGGTLSWTLTSTTEGCLDEGSVYQETYYTLWTFSSFVYTVGGVSYPMSGAATYNNDPCGLGPDCRGTCLTPGASPSVLSLTYDPSGEACTISFTPSGGSGSASDSCVANVQGYINPKYVVVGVTYAPPGASSNVTYTNTTSVGNTTTISNSFSNDVGFSVSDSMGGSISAGGVINGKFTITTTESTDYTQGSSNSTTTTISKASTVAYKTSGTPIEAPVNSDYDYIWLWLNPELIVTYTPASGSNPEGVVLNGYGMDPNDPATGQPQTGVTYTAGPDVIEVQVGCLDGHFSCGSDLVWSNGEAPGSFITSGLLARGWQSAANGYSWPSGEQPGLSFSDVCQILTFDPFATTPSQCSTQNDYTLLNSLPSTTTDGRFSKIPYPPNPIQYPVGGANESYSMVQTDTQSESTGNSTQIKQAFSVSEQFSTSAFWGLVSNSITFKESDTLTWNYSTLNTLTTTTTLTNALSITGPPDTPLRNICLCSCRLLPVHHKRNLH
jgi:hypothetical protein